MSNFHLLDDETKGARGRNGREEGEKFLRPLTDIKFKPIPLAAHAAEYSTIFTVSCTAPKGDTSNNSSKNERACAKKSLLAVLLAAQRTKRGRIRGKSLQGDPCVSHLAAGPRVVVARTRLIECNPGRMRWLPLIQGSRRSSDEAPRPRCRR